MMSSSLAVVGTDWRRRSYLSKYHGITKVAVLEKGYLADGNTARNTTTIRSNYITNQSIRFYKEAVSLYENMSHELNFNVMFSQRGQLTLAHSVATPSICAPRWASIMERGFGR
ncbi:FAD-dependent oxidoreductase [Bradyrhizobium arachidis]|uniref:FAD-dependent oxidoreductase n=1 Tax=Bradyrhizobium arachidis TaxID=858423 RepID=UPI002867F9AD|nr:FAD-dependent oxidoreductase [Bradyrhizobium arachidis]